MVIPSIKINPTMTAKLGIASSGDNNITETEQVIRVIVEPLKWMEAHNGTVKLAIFSSTSFALVACRETGIVAALDIVPKAVK